MIASALKPDNITFISLLVTCSHVGLVEKGRDIVQSMSEVYDLSLEKDHVACMVDMLARKGYLKEARKMVETYRRTHKSSEAVFGACYAYNELELGGDLKIMEPESEMSYVELSNVYYVRERWREALVRKAMADEGVKKVPGCSWIEVKNKAMAFVAGSSSLCVYKDGMSSILHLLEYQLKNPW